MRNAGELPHKHAQDYHRTCKCLRQQHGLVQVLRSKAHGASHYGGLVICGSVWACPVCAAKVQERRRQEIRDFFHWAYNKAQGKKVVMVTLTFPHQAWHNLSTLIDQQSDALRRLRRGGPWDRIKAGAGYEGLIRSLELSHGQNGWHPHTHELWLVDHDCDADWLRSAVLRRWRASCQRAGLLDEFDESQQQAFSEHGVDVHDNAHEGDYLAKQDDGEHLRGHWGADAEMAKSSTKKGRAKGRHPFQLLADFGEGDMKAGQLFLEYAQVMKGKRQIFWTHGLKDRVGLNDKTDEELAQEQDDYADTLALLDKPQWKAVIKEKARATILDIAEKDGREGIVQWFLVRNLSPPKLPSQKESGAE